MAIHIISRIFVPVFFLLALTASSAYADCAQANAATSQQDYGFKKQGAPANTPSPGLAAMGANSGMACIAGRESGGFQNVTNGWGYTGMFQFGVNAAATGGFCSNSPPLQNCIQNWKTCTFAGSDMCIKYGICKYEDFASNSPNAIAASIEAQQRYQDANWRTILAANPGLEQKITDGLTVDGVKVTKETLLAIAQLRGAGNIAPWLKNEYVKPDANGTTQTGYATCVQQCLENQAGYQSCDPSQYSSCVHKKTTP